MWGSRSRLTPEGCMVEAKHKGARCAVPAAAPTTLPSPPQPPPLSRGIWGGLGWGCEPHSPLFAAPYGHLSTQPGPPRSQARPPSARPSARWRQPRVPSAPSPSPRSPPGCSRWSGAAPRAGWRAAATWLGSGPRRSAMTRWRPGGRWRWGRDVSEALLPPPQRPHCGKKKSCFLPTLCFNFCFFGLCRWKGKTCV